VIYSCGFSVTEYKYYSCMNTEIKKRKNDDLQKFLFFFSTDQSREY